MNPESISRRQALTQLSQGVFGLGAASFLLPSLSGLLLSGCQSETGTSSAQPFAYDVPQWTGDTFGPMHLIRDGRQPQSPQKPSQHVDVVIVGGGLSGLTVATQLINEDFLLLEREQTLGGNAKSGEFNGIEYALGSAYLVDVSEPFGPFYESLGLPLKPLPEPADYLMNAQNQLVSLPKSSVGKDFERMKEFLSTLLKNPDFPKSPVQDATANALKLDTITFSEFLNNEHYSSEFVQLVNAYCWSALGGSVDSISAYAGLNFYSEIAAPVYAFPGGNAAVAKAMAQKIQTAGANRIKTGVAVTQIKPNSDHSANEGFLVSFWNYQTNEMATVSCRTVVMAIPYFFAGRLLPFLPKAITQAMKSLQYGAYLVGNLCFDQPVFQHGGYDHWVLNSPSRNLAKTQVTPEIQFTDFIDAGFAQRSLNPKQKQNGSVVTIYAPFQNPWPGRMLLKNGDKDSMAQSLVEAVQQRIPFENKHLQSVRLTRYGHQLLTSQKGIIETVRKLPKETQGIIFAHSDGQGMAAIESAVLEGLSAASLLKERLKTPQMAVP
jgi:protoporphyrinogen oxidase